MPREGKRPKAKGISPTLNEDVAAQIKGMMARGDRQSDIAAYFQINQGRIVEIGSGKRFRSVAPASAELLPPPGPYVVVTRVSHERAQVVEEVLARMVKVMEEATADLRTRFASALQE